MLVVLSHLTGSQKPGGLIEVKHEDVAKALGYSQSHISHIFHLLETENALHGIRTGPRTARAAL